MTKNEQKSLAIVDDDHAVLDSFWFLLEVVGHPVQSFKKFLQLRAIAAFLGITVMSIATRHSVAQELGDAREGRHIAETWCSTCHVVGFSSASASSNGAPTFAAVARMKSTTVLSLRAFLQTPHAGMPDLHLSRAEIDDLATYILSLRRGD